MMEVTTSTTTTIDHLQRLLHLYEQGFQSDTIDHALVKLVEHAVQQARNERDRLQERLLAYERQYHMRSDEFERRFQAGELGDDANLVEWSIFYDLYRNAQQQLQALQAE